ncbi:MBL fold metallo-hydrolase [Streptomyces adustus]|uniref:MBL fold metallo-hydrolase n=1 Tax=Streptomyces adustus TaxID=1609272 RepID=UPI0035E07BF1
MSGAPTVERVVTTGVFALGEGSWEVENNVWIVGDDREVVVVDPAHDADAVVRAVNGRHGVAIGCTPGHNDHINAAPELGERLDAPVRLHPGGRQLWEMTHPGRTFQEIADGTRIRVAGTEPTAIHAPGHSPRSVCLHLPDADALFSGDTLFRGGPGATGRSFSDFPTVIASIRDRLLGLPGHTRVHTGHGDGTTVAREAPHLGEWIRRGR